MRISLVLRYDWRLRPAAIPAQILDLIYYGCYLGWQRLHRHLDLRAVLEVVLEEHLAELGGALKKL